MTSGTLRVGVVGAGSMGRNHVRILSDLAGSSLAGVYDRRPEASAAVAREQGARIFSSVDELADQADAAVIATPTSSHVEIGCQLLERGLHILVEKPLAPSLATADQLIAAASKAGKVLAVGHIEFFNPTVQKLVGVGLPPRFVEVQRLAVFSPRSLDVDVVLDLMIHDLQILHALDGGGLGEVRATGIPVLSPKTDIANARVEFASGCVANLTASRVSAERVRKLRIFLPSRYYSLDYQAQEIHGFRLEESGMGRRIVADDLGVERAEPLRCELEAFVRSCRGESAPIVSGASARQALASALQVVEAIERTR
jgi:predicted dehydrogenase